MTGVGLGLLVAVPVSRLISGFLFGTTPFDAYVFTGTSVILIGMALSASLVPAQRAASVDPATVLRGD